MDFIKAMDMNGTTETENGATIYSTSGKKLVDLNFKVPALREMAINNNIDAMWNVFSDAYAEDANHTLKWLLFLRDIRGGIGERESFRKFLIAMCKYNIELAYKFFQLDLEEFGRFDDVISIYNDVNSGIQGIILSKISRQLAEDRALMQKGKSISLLAKWMPSINTSSAKTRAIANKLASDMHLTPRQYRKILASLRKYLNVVEVNLTAKDYEKIDYSAVPSKANILYNETFMRNDEERRLAYLESLKEGKTKINANAMFLHDIVHAYGYAFRGVKKDCDTTLEELWKAQTKCDSFTDTLVVRDGSGSMTISIGNTTVTALEIATAITLYCAENNNGMYKNKFVTFSSRPRICSVNSLNSLREKLNYCYRHDDCSSTNIEAVFDLMLRTAIKNHVSQDEMPKTVLIISDMEFNPVMMTNNYCMSEEEQWNTTKTLFETIKDKFAAKGYILPKLVFWNVNARTDGIPIQENEAGVILLSGFSKELMNMVCSSETNPYNALIKVLDAGKYNCVNTIV